jgi:hypothetical protein
VRGVVFLVVFVFGALVSASWIDDTTVCPVLREGQPGAP